MIDPIRIFLPVYGAIFFFVVFCLRTVIVSKRTGINAYVLLKSKGAQGVIGRYFRILPILSALVIVVYSFFPNQYHLLAPFFWIESRFAVTTGVVILLLTLAWIWASQTQMGNSWRIGVDEKERTELVLNGVFSISRNPIFLGMKLNSFAFFLIVPNAVTLAILVAGIALIDVQVAIEEKYLEAVHGEKYKNYCSRVRRWI